MQLKMIRPIGKRNQITIPHALLKRLGLHPGDLVNFRQQKEGILLKPVEVIERSEEWAKEELSAMELMFDNQKKKNNYVRFDDTESALKYLKTIMKKK